MATAIAGAIANQAFKVVAKDRNILIPLDNVSNTGVYTNTQLKRKFCDTPKKQGRITKRKQQNNLDRILERN